MSSRWRRRVPTGSSEARRADAADTYAKLKPFAVIDYATYFGNNEATVVTYVSATELQCTSPAAAAAGAVTVRVTNIDNQSGSLAGAFEYTQVPGFIRGDANMSATVDLADAVMLAARRGPTLYEWAAATPERRELRGRLPAWLVPLPFDGPNVVVRRSCHGGPWWPRRRRACAAMPMPRRTGRGRLIAIRSRIRSTWRRTRPARASAARCWAR